jgi:hypothetical protein
MLQFSLAYIAIAPELKQGFVGVLCLKIVVLDGFSDV